MGNKNYLRVTMNLKYKKKENRKYVDRPTTASVKKKSDSKKIKNGKLNINQSVTNSLDVEIGANASLKKKKITKKKKKRKAQDKKIEDGNDKKIIKKKRKKKKKKHLTAKDEAKLDRKKKMKKKVKSINIG